MFASCAYAVCVHVSTAAVWRFLLSHCDGAMFRGRKYGYRKEAEWWRCALSWASDNVRQVESAGSTDVYVYAPVCVIACMDAHVLAFMFNRFRKGRSSFCFCRALLLYILRRDVPAPRKRYCEIQSDIQTFSLDL